MCAPDPQTIAQSIKERVATDYTVPLPKLPKAADANTQQDTSAEHNQSVVRVRGTYIPRGIRTRQSFTIHR